MTSPVLTKNKNFQPGKTATPYASYNLAVEPTINDKITVDSVLSRTGISFLVLLAAAVVGWQFPILIFPGVIGGLVFGLTNAFKREPSPTLIVLYAVFEGAALGGISSYYESAYSGIVLQAVLGTFAVAGVVLGLFKFTGLRATARGTKIFLAITFGYILFSLLNLVLM